VTESSRTVARSLDLLELLATRDEGWTIAELVTALGFGRASIYRLLAPFEAKGYTRRGGDGRVRLGLAVLALARRAEPAVLAVALPVLRALAEDVGATAHLAMREGNEAVAIAVVEPSWTDVHVAYRVGTRHPLGVAATGRALGAVRATDGPSWWTSSGELQTGAHGVAAPVRGLEGVELAIGVISLASLDAANVGPAVVAAAEALAVALA
jgi:DNA-binding IclR family transcriptional regulator